jgi:ubiquinone/menaquinone biosynthesis C-methylase UbiE
MVKHVMALERKQPHSINYIIGNAMNLPFVDGCFDFVSGFMSFMDIPEHEKLISEASRVLKSDGIFQFAIIHLTEAAQRLANGDLTARVGELVTNRKDELAESAKNFNLMADRISYLLEGGLKVDIQIPI